jgi:uncharacterized membrane protein YbhN (UPF0104 family)
MSLRRRSRRAPAAWQIRWTRLGGFAAVGLAFLAIPPLAHVPGRLVAACAKWIAVGAALELLSVLGYVLVFALVFCSRMSKRQSVGAALRALGASTVLPAGGLVGPAMGVRTARAGDPPLGVVKGTLAFTMLTTAPSVIVLGALGLTLWLGWPSGPHCASLTLPAAGLAWALVAGGWRLGGSLPKRGARNDQRRGSRGHLADALMVVREGARATRHMVAAGNWKLVGAIGYYACDNAVLWTAFRAFGHAPAPSVIVMGYLVGSLGTALPVPAGIGAAEGGLIGALVLYGAPAGPAAGAVLLYRGISLSLPLTFGAIAWTVGPVMRLRPAHGPPSGGAGAIRAEDAGRQRASVV